jgi:molecular chaperone GrpE
MAERRGAPEPRNDEAEVQAADAGAQVAEDLDELNEAKRERDEYLELAQRTRADFENYRKRVAKEASEALARGKAELARELLPVIDNLERALQAAGVSQHPAARGRELEERAVEAPSEEVSAHEALARGVALVLDELSAKLLAAGVEAYDPHGERFDPELHEALSTRPEEGTESGIVVETVEKGYRLNGQVLRPARVVVSD